jgi:scyllo-inositol 2-dehydrogenase (NADP+)
VRAVIIGYGNIGRKRKEVLGGECIATVDPYNVEADYRRIEEIALSEYDSVVLSLPNEEKERMIRWALERGKNVLVEKPFLPSSPEIFDEFKMIAKAHSAIFYVSYNHRFEPQVQKMKSLLSQSEIGEIYQGRFFYGNGTIQNVLGTWRDQGLGVLEDLGSHLVDLYDYLIGNPQQSFKMVAANRYEGSSCDHVIFQTADGHFLFETSMISWKNTFTIDLYGEKGSLHLDGLSKWGGSTLSMRKRVFPSGRPEELVQTLYGVDRSWRDDWNYFTSLVAQGRSTFEKDRWIADSLWDCGQMETESGVLRPVAWEEG